MKLLPALDPRKAAIVNLVPRTAVAAEIGADHGILSAHLLREDICQQVIVADISAASLGKAKRLFALHGMEERAFFRVTDGLDAIHDPVDVVIIAGMGGKTIVEILRRGYERIGEASLILQANTDMVLLRSFLSKNGFCLDAECLAWDGRRYYPAMRAVRGTAYYSEKDLFLGPCLLRKRPAGWWDYLAWMHACKKKVEQEKNERHLEWLEEELKAT